MKVLVFFCLLAVATAEFKVAKIEPCDPPNPDGTPAAQACEVHEVRIDPCQKNKPDRPCGLRKLERASMSFDFTPNFSASELKTMAFWPGPGGEVKFEGMGGTDGCEFTSCPLEPGKKQTFNYELTLGKKLPTGTYIFKWKVWNTENPTQDVCCFQTKVNLKKPSSKK